MGEPEIRTVFYFAVGTAVAGALGMALTGASAWNWQQALWLPPIGILASLGQLAMTRPTRCRKTMARTLMVANLQYSGIVFAALYSLILVWRQYSADGLGRHGAHHRQRHRRHGAARARGARCAG